MRQLLISPGGPYQTNRMTLAVSYSPYIASGAADIPVPSQALSAFRALSQYRLLFHVHYSYSDPAR